MKVSICATWSRRVCGGWNVTWHMGSQLNLRRNYGATTETKGRCNIFLFWVSLWLRNFGIREKLFEALKVESDDRCYGLYGPTENDVL